ncbi:cell surface protein [candidate division TA06 bacterium B3_TA06]|uniref:Cell surface protein n=1 Tax=candidate division TA06 bacterium B3_TA06 TaxID=2012487 RepID=A0A532V808_UNCT6|nr:MAG: cell surface protein [candidate division TA06 bacterium B3_TA06]
MFDIEQLIAIFQKGGLVKRTLLLFLGLVLTIGILGCKEKVGEDDRLIWKYKIGALCKSCPAIDEEGTIYIGSGDNYLYAINTDGTLKQMWETSGCPASPVISLNKIIYVGCDDGDINAIQIGPPDPEDTLKPVSFYYHTNYKPGYDVSYSPAIGEDGTIYMVRYYYGDSYLYGSYEQLCRLGGYPTQSSPSIGSDGTIYIEKEYSFCAINKDGSLKWGYKLPKDETKYSSPSPAAIGADGTIYLGLGGSLYVLTRNGNLKWRYRTGYAINASPVIDKAGNIYVVSGTDCLLAITPRGNLKWRHEFEGYISTPVIGSEGTIYLVENRKNIIWFTTSFRIKALLHAINSNGSLKWTYNVRSECRHITRYSDTEISEPTIGSDGTLYFSFGKYLYAVKSDSKGLANSSWPRQGHDNQNTGRVNAP